MAALAIPIDRSSVESFADKWHLRGISLFGSVLRDDFHPGSDVDVLVEFCEGFTLTFESYVEMRDELSTFFGGREIDLVELRRLADPYRRHEILRTREAIYVRRSARAPDGSCPKMVMELAPAKNH